MSGPVKILAVGSALGSIQELFSKVKAIDAKHGKFDLLLCTGDFFGPPEDAGDSQKDEEISLFLDGHIEVPIECYIMQGEYSLPVKVVEKFAKTGGELCKNAFLMSKSGTITTANGLRIACLGGIYNPDIYYTSDAPPGFTSPFFSSQTVERLLANTMAKTSSSKNYSSLSSISMSASSSQLIDILLTNSWPQAIVDHSSILAQAASASGSPPLDDVIRRTKPRYYFASSGGHPPKFWEREPFLWGNEDNRVTRFLNLGAFGAEPVDGKKQRWFYAFSIAPAMEIKSNTPQPANATPNPFTEGPSRPNKRSVEPAQENYIFGGTIAPPVKRAKVGYQGNDGKPPPGYKCRRCESTEHFINDCPERIKPTEGYVCKICNTPGHLVRDCPTRDALGDTGGKKPKPGYICRACGSEDHYLDDCLVANQRQPQGERRGGRRGPPREIAPEECWFCLSNPNLAKHLIVSIGTECYVTLPKGQIVPTQSAGRSDIPGGGHVLIVPITHYPTYSTIPGDLAPPILEETEKYKSALRALCAKYHSAAVTFEVGRLSQKGGHAHVQVVPVPSKLQDKVEEAFLHEGRMQGIDFEEDPEGALTSCANGRGSYFKVELPDGRKMVHLLKDHGPFNIQFGRQVLVSLLGIPDRADWRVCALPEEEEKADANAFKAAFSPFDPSLS